MPNKKIRTHSRAQPRTEDPSSSGFRAARRLPTPDEPPLAGAEPKPDAELDQRVFMLVTAVSENDGMVYTPEWATVADAAKRRGYLEEHGLRLYMRKHGEQWLESRSKPRGAPGAYTMTKCTPLAKLHLKDLAHDTGVPMQDAIGDIIAAIHDRRDALTRLARKHGATHPWEAIRFLVK